MSKPPVPMQYCAVCLVAKNENKYIREWAEYHLRIGFDALIVYDNESRVPLRDELDDLIRLGRATVHGHASHPAGWLKTQASAYADCMTRYTDAFKWIAVIDADEFIVPKKTCNIKEFLAEYECYGAVTAHWVIFGSSGLQKNESASQIFSFIHTAAEDSTTIKSIVQPRKVRVFTGPHGADLLPGQFAVSPDHFPLEPCVYSAPFTVEAVQLNHYWWRAREDYEAKAALKAGNKRPHSKISFAGEQEKHCRKNFEIVKLYSELQNLPIGPYAPPAVPDNIRDMTALASAMLEEARHAELEEYLCQAVLVFGDDPLVWMLRAASARARGRLPRALHCIREASKLSGSSSIYYELARIYEAMGEKNKAARARQQADYKKQVEDSTCA